MFGKILDIFEKKTEIATMKAEEKLEATVDPVDDVKLDIKKKKQKSAELKKSIDGFKQDYHLANNKVMKAKQTAQEFSQKYQGYQKALASGKINQGQFDMATSNMQKEAVKLQQIIAENEPKAASIKVNVDKLEAAKKRLDNEVAKLESSLSQAASASKLAETNKAVAELLSGVDENGESSALARLEAKTAADQASADAMMDSIADTSSLDTIDTIILENSVPEGDPFAMITGGETPALAAGNPFLQIEQK